MKKTVAKLLAALLCVTLLCGAFAACDQKKETTDDAGTGTSEPAESGIWLPFVENK